MPNIKTYDAGELQLRPSESGSAAYRELGGVASHMAGVVQSEYSKMGSAIGSGVNAITGAIEKQQKDAEAHNDAMAMIDFHSDLADQEIARQGEVHMGGTPTASDGTPITDNPGRGANGSLPPDANVPSPGQFKQTASDAIEDHDDYTADLLGRYAGRVSPKTFDRMQATVAASQDRLRIQAHAVAGEVAFNHATSTTEGTINSTYGSLSRGEMSLPDAMDHIDGALDSFQSALSGDFAAKGSKLIEQRRQEAKSQAIWTSAQSELLAGHVDKAAAIINDKRWDAVIGGPTRDKMLGDLGKTQQQWVKAQNDADKQKEAEIGNQQDSLVDQIYRNSRLPADQQNPSLSRLALEKSPLFVNRPADLEKARKNLDALTNNTIDPSGSMRIAQGISKGITDGSITSAAQIDQAYNPDQPGKSLTWQDRTRLQSELKDATNNPAIKEFNANVKDWLGRNAGQIDRTLGADKTGNSKSELGQESISRWQAEVQRRAQIMRGQPGKDPHSLLDPNSPDSMVSPQALAPYRVTAQMEQQYQKQQGAIDTGINAQRGTGSVPTGELTTPDTLKSVPNLMRNRQTGQFYDPANKQFYNSDGSKAQMTLQPPKATPAPDAAPITLPKGMTPADVRKNYPPGTRFIIPDGAHSGKIGVVPGRQSMNFAPDQQSGSSPARQAIDDALQPRPDAHADKNLFSSGRAEEMGIKGGIGQNLTQIAAQGQTTQVNAQAAPHFKGFLDELTARGYKIESLGGFNERTKRGGTSMSEHAFGNAIDINPGNNPFHSHATDLPKDISRIAARYGLIWGGDWSGGSADPMHFEWSGKGGLTQFAGR